VFTAGISLEHTDPMFTDGDSLEHTDPMFTAGISLEHTYPHVFTVGVGVLVVRIDVELHKSDGIECGRVDYRHVVGCVDAFCGHIGSCTRTDVGDPILGK
jgi:hypothetical protein